MGNKENSQKKHPLLVFLKFFFLGIIFSVFLALGILLILLQRPVYSEQEKRPLAEKPVFSLKALFNGDYFAELQAYYDDTIPNRENFKRMGDKLLSYKGYAKDDIYIYIPDQGGSSGKDKPSQGTPEPSSPGTGGDIPGVSPNPDETGSPSGQETPVPATDTEDGAGEYYESQGIIVYKDRAMELYGGSRSRMQEYAAALNKLHERMPGIEVWSMNIPIASAYYLPSQFANRSADQLKDSEYIRSLLAEGVHYVDVYNTLKARVQENIYLKTDHHWTYLGAYYAIEQFMKDANVARPDLKRHYTTKSADGVLGSFYTYYGVGMLVNYPETFVWYEPNFKFTATYYRYDSNQVVSTSTNTMFFYSTKPQYDMVNHGDSYLTHITTENKSGRKVAVFKDSFGNATGPFLAAGFDEVWVIDLRYYTGDIYKFLQEQGITDVLMASCMFTNAGGAAANYTRLFNS